MVRGYVQADLRSPVVHKYLQKALESWKCVEDVFEIIVVQCIKPNEDLYDSVKYREVEIRVSDFDSSKRRSPQEIASLLSQYRYMKRIAKGEQLFIMEHDAYLEGEEEFRRVLGKFHQMLVCNVGIAMECYTCCADVAEIFCELVENDYDHNYRGPMTILHKACDQYSQQIRNKSRNVWWPKSGQTNETGLSNDVSTAFRSPMLTIPAPVTQIIDPHFGSTVTDRERINPKYTKKTHPNFRFVELDLS
jgi:hypothetical protein